MWDKITYPFPNFNSFPVEVWKWISNFIPHIILDAIIFHVSKSGYRLITIKSSLYDILDKNLSIPVSMSILPISILSDMILSNFLYPIFIQNRKFLIRCNIRAAEEGYLSRPSCVWALKNYLNQCWPTSSEVLSHSPGSNFPRNA